MVIGITGKIGVGKSTVTRILQSYGWAVIDADKIGNSVASKTPAVLARLAKKFGDDILTPTGRLRRKVLRKKAFKNKKTTQTLNKIVHPYLVKEIFAQIKKHTLNNQNVLIDAALLFDWNLDKKINKTILVHTNKKLRMERMQKRGFSKTVFLEIDKQQKSFQSFRKRSDFLIYNSGSEKELKIKVKRLLKKLSL